MPYEVVDQRTNDVCEDDDDNPNELVVPAAWLFGSAINNHPDPECEPGGDEQQDWQCEQQF
jgi:hypothetical protein